MSDIQFVITGGTIGMRENEAGRLIPDENGLDECALRVGIDAVSAKKPYIIDSINFNIGVDYPDAGSEILYKDYPKLLACVKAVLDSGKTPLISGGTDSKIWSSGLLVRDLMRQRYLQKGSGQKILFVSSMKTIRQAPQLVENILRAAKLLNEESSLSGGFAISAMNETGSVLAVHDVLNGFDKISHSLMDAFRSAAPIGTIRDGRFEKNKNYRTPPSPEPSEIRRYAHIAPPLVRGQSNAAMLAYMRAIGNSPAAFDGMVIEGLPEFRPGETTAITDTIKHLTQSGMRVVFCNPVRYDADKQKMAPTMPTNWNEGGFAGDLAKAGAEFVTGMPKDVYLDMVLSTPARTQKPDSQAVPPARQKGLRIRYVPDVATMAHAMNVLAPVAEHILFYAMPNNVMPGSMLPSFSRHKDETSYYSTFEYNGNRYEDAEGKPFTEGAGDNPYKAGHRLSNGVSIGTINDFEAKLGNAAAKTAVR